MIHRGEEVPALIARVCQRRRGRSGERRGAGRLVAVLTLLAMLAGAAGAGAQVRERDWPRERPPQPLQPREIEFPPYEIHALENGMSVVVVRHHEQPAVSVRMLIRAGGAYDPPGTPGVASLVASLLDQGTTSRSAGEIAGEIDYVGGMLSAGSGTDLSFVNATVLRTSFDLALDLFADVVRNPAFDPLEIERQRQQTMSSLQVGYQDPDYVANMVFSRLVFGFHPYGLPNNGTPDSVASITRDDLVAFHRAYFAPNNIVLAVVGDITPDEALASVDRVFGDWPRRDVVPPVRMDPPEPTSRMVIVDRPGAVQTEIRVGHLGVPRSHPDYMAINFAIRILGGEGGNRLQRVLRSERGLTYGAQADMNALKQSGMFIADTDTRSEATAEVLRVVVDEFSRLQRDRVFERELADTKAYLTGNFPQTIETPQAIATQILNAVFHGLPLEELQNYRERVNAVSPADIQRAARSHLRPDRLSIVLVGDAAAFEADLRGAGFRSFERISLDELDLAAADFRRDPAPQPAGSARP